MPTTKKRVWLTFGNRDMVETPALWRMTSKFPDVSFDIRQASVTAEIGIMAVLFAGETERVESALQPAAPTAIPASTNARDCERSNSTAKDMVLLTHTQQRPTQGGELTPWR